MRERSDAMRWAFFGVWTGTPYRRCQPLQRFRQAIHTRPVDPAPAARPEATRRVLAYPIGIIPPLAVEFISRRNVVHPTPDTQVQRSAVESVHLLELFPRYRHRVLGVDIVLDLDGLLDP